MATTASTSSGNEREMAVLFADVCGSTRLYDQLGDEQAFSAINFCLDMLRGLSVAHQGRVVKTIGDEIMVVFPDANSAVLAAAEMQHEVAELPPVGGMQIAIRVGFHYGAVIESEEDGDVFGDTVNVAARMADLANSGQIITSAATAVHLPAIMRNCVRALDLLTVKGKAEDMKICEVLWQEESEMTMMVSRTLPPSSRQTSVRLKYGGREYVVDAARPALTLGRDDLADLVVHDRRASRLHARIERRRDKFVFVDQSANGSFITFGDEDEIELRREEVVLRGSGRISLGHPVQEDRKEAVEFYCE